MSEKRIFPESIVRQSFIHVISEYRKTGKLLYWIVLAAMAVCFVSLFLISVDVGVRAAGVIKPVGERNVITSPGTGLLVGVNLKENRAVQKGDTLFVVRAENIDAQRPALERRRQELREMIRDLSLLLDGGNPANVRLSSPVYGQEYASYRVQLSEHEYNEQVAEKNYRREKQLYDSKVISLYDFELVKEKYDNIRTAGQVFRQKTYAQWQSQRNQYQHELREIETQYAQLDIQSREMIVTAPVSGSIQRLENIADGMFVHSGQKIVELSPDGELVAECYVSPRDIGLLFRKQECRIQVDAFNYNQWGIVEGEVVDIFRDVVTAGGERAGSFYPVYCSLGSDHLTLSNGYKGYIKKGMTVSVRMIVTRRTLFQLMYDKVDDWLNPSRNNQ